jgi:hypothetical protein
MERGAVDVFSEIKAAVLDADLTPIAQSKFNASDYGFGAVCLKLPRIFETDILLELADKYTSGNNGVIVSPGPLCGGGKIEQWLIMPSGAAEELKANLRSNSPKKTTRAGAGQQAR